MSAPARVEGVWFRTTARPESKPCDSCNQYVKAGAPIAYRRRGPHSDLLHEACARRTEALPGVSVWDHARTASTPEARGQVALAAVPEDDEPGPDVAAMLRDARARERAAYADLEAAGAQMATAADSLAQATATYALARSAFERCERMAEDER